MLHLMFRYLNGLQPTLTAQRSDFKNKNGISQENRRQLMSLPTSWAVAKSTCQDWICYPEVAEKACCTCDTTQCHSHDPRSDDMLRATGTQSQTNKIRRNHNCTEKHSLPTTSALWQWAPVQTNCYDLPLQVSDNVVDSAA